MKFSCITLLEMIEYYGEEEVSKILSSFSSYKNPDTELYIKEKAIDDSRNGISQTHLVFMEGSAHNILVGYFTIMAKMVFVEKKWLSINKNKKLHELAIYDNDRNGFKVLATLLMQFSKNFTDGVNKYIEGDDLLNTALGLIRQAQKITGGSVVYLECYNTVQVRLFYKQNGFSICGKRTLDKDEIHKWSGKIMLQMLDILD